MTSIRSILCQGLLLLTLAIPAHATTTINVGVYNFPPIAQVNASNQATGLLGDLLNALEETHPDIRFHIVYTSPRRRYLDYDNGLFDVMFFESPEWQWEHKGVLISPPILMDEELYVALNKPGRDLSFFDDIADRNIVAMAGYHYGFAGFETNSRKLAEKFHIEFSDSHRRNLELIKADRPSVAEVAIMSYSYLQRHLAQHPEDWDRLLISDRPDQVYKLSVIARPDGPVTADDMMNLLSPLVANGRYRMLVEQWGLRLPPGFLSHFPDVPSND